MTTRLFPVRMWSKSPEELDEKVIDVIYQGEMVEIPQGGDNPSKFLYKDMGGHLYYAELKPYKFGDQNDYP